MKDATVFLVDDDASVRDALGLLLSLKGMRTQLFAAAEAFLETYRPEWRGCVLTDLRMPAMSGLDLLTHMRAEGYNAPFIFITAFPEESVRARALKAGAICFLAKPFAGHVLINCVETALTEQRGRADK